MTSPSNLDCDVIVIGAGAAGLMAAAAAGSRGRKVFVLEKNRKVGVKILMSGGTRCNITHQCHSRAIVEAFGTSGRFLHSALASLSPHDVVDLIEAQGVATKTESTGKIFPVSNRAIDVRDALVRLAVDAGAQILTQVAVSGLQNEQTHFALSTAKGEFHCKKVIVTTGGMSYPGCGTTGDGYPWAEKLGHRIVPPVPALTPITSNLAWVNELKGVTIADSRISLADSSGASSSIKRSPSMDSRYRGSLLFTHFGFSGPPVLNLSRQIALRASPAGLALNLDFAPDVHRENLGAQLRDAAKGEGNPLVSTVLSRMVPRRLVSALMRQANVVESLRTAETSKSHWQAIVNALKQTRVPISGILGFKKAEVTAGGVSLADVDSRTMESKIIPGLYFAGEILDLDGPIGGFNFQSAFSTGWLAGHNV